MIETERLILRPWRNDDVEPFMAGLDTPAVTRWLGGLKGKSDYLAAAERMTTAQKRDGHCFWIVERRIDAAVLGFCGIRRTDHPGTPVHEEAELGWRLREDAWGAGYAKEAALASIAWGWANLAVDRLIAYTVSGNTASWGLMERLGMNRAIDLDFDHPDYPQGHELCRHIVYSIARPR